MIACLTMALKSTSPCWISPERYGPQRRDQRPDMRSQRLRAMAFGNTKRGTVLNQW